jgi:hypothetical protein
MHEQAPGLRGRVLRFLRRNLFDYFGRPLTVPCVAVDTAWRAASDF